MIHLTLNTGHARITKRAEIDDSVIRKMKPLLVTGVHPLRKFHKEFRDYRVMVTSPKSTGMLATIYRGKVPILMMGVAGEESHAKEVWESLAETYEFALKEHAPMRPKSTPWLGAAILRPDDAMDWLGDFERCLAWTWMESR